MSGKYLIKITLNPKVKVVASYIINLAGSVAGSREVGWLGVEPDVHAVEQEGAG